MDDTEGLPAVRRLMHICCPRQIGIVICERADGANGPISDLGHRLLPLRAFFHLCRSDLALTCLSNPRLRLRRTCHSLLKSVVYRAPQEREVVVAMPQAALRLSITLATQIA